VFFSPSEETQEVLELIPEESAAAPESTSVAEVSEAPAQVTQTSNLPLIIPSHVSPSNDSDLDDVPIGQRMRKLSKPSPQPQQQPLNYHFRLNSLQLLLNVLRILKTLQLQTYPNVTHP